MIPTMIAFGLLAGRWWRTALVLATVGWPIVLLVDGAIGLHLPDLLLAALLGFANAAVGVAVHQGLLRAFRGARRSQARRAAGTRS